jgi:hypothetical protein
VDVLFADGGDAAALCEGAALDVSAGSDSVAAYDGLVRRAALLAEAG